MVSQIFFAIFRPPADPYGDPLRCIGVARNLPRLALDAPMKIAITKPLFAWDALEDSPSLQSLRLLLEAIPDQALLDSLRAAR